ncbi:orotidine-5'-phosphate decarboxylase [Halorussus halophilus]|uniref:orotidine-5'-phosphate decarboxylase n=1 Tax=Halorussus halophilus TaxID=2650975 RepID=UPI00130160B5|nr:orotidine-5'-phosphate decarboxylase [Halorussus halophilus]
MTATFFDRLGERIRSADSVLSVGLSPDLGRLPDAVADYDYPRRAFNRRIIDATHDHVAAYTANLASYEDSAGWISLAETVAYAEGKGVPVVLDGKRADIGNTSEQYAKALDSADAVTVNPYLGEDALAPFFDREERGVFVTCRTPNSGARNIQGRELASGETVAERVAEMVEKWADDAAADVGLLVGGDSETVEILREQVELPFLVVGGARNDPEVAEYALADGVGLVDASREVIYASESVGANRGYSRDDDAFAAPARQAARRLKRQLNRYR